MFANMDTPPNVFVFASEHGGHSPEQIAEMCVNKLILISDQAPPEIAQQARALRDRMRDVVLYYVRLAVSEARETTATRLEQAGEAELAKCIRSL